MATVKVLVVGGGGGGGNGVTGANGGGGGAGGFIYDAAFSINPGSYAVTVGDGGPHDTNGQDSVFSSLTAVGGGSGGGVSYADAGGNGGSGGGGNTGLGAGGTATAGQGNNGGIGADSGTYYGAGGGGAGAGPTTYFGGTAISNSISGAAVLYSEGGPGSLNGQDNTTNGTPNRGNGAGGGLAATQSAGGTGGSGVVIVSYVTADFPLCTGGTKTTDGANTVHTFTTSGTFFIPAGFLIMF